MPDPAVRSRKVHLGSLWWFLTWQSLARMICLQIDGCGGQGDVWLLASSWQTASFPDLLGWRRALHGVQAVSSLTYRVPPSPPSTLFTD